MPSSLSRPALELARRFLLLPCYSTIMRHIDHDISSHERNLRQETKMRDEVGLFKEVSRIEQGDIVSVAVDAMVMSTDRSCLVAKSGDDLFVFYAQPLARSKKSIALHVFRGQSGHAGDPIQYFLDSICQGLKDAGVVVRYVCSDGDFGYSERHYKFFKEWHSALLTHGLLGALDILDRTDKIPVSDFVHLW
jgi:hypothetical protein